ncbi:Nif3-like dinuclear metal center hexameric protein [Bizionia sediminis]|uniref:GTP cyclohydrolase 1 type 2 homolog n=1 Tax=Bizionia sediminis TaxID=1737064 RepID=A0ABW5KUA2_9FLAO
MIVQDLITILENFAPNAYAEDFDNVGLLVGNSSEKITGILVTLDTTEAVVDEAIKKKCNTIVSFHPIIFKGLKTLTGKNYVQRVAIKAIKHNIAIYAIHTALDNAIHGVNDMICQRLNLTSKTILIPQQNTIKKLTTYVPHKHANTVREALFKAGAGSIGNYSGCSFNTQGTGTFTASANANPVIGNKLENHEEPETKITVTFPKHLKSSILKALFAAHIYEEVAYEITALENTNQHIGMGMVGNLHTPMEELEFLAYVKQHMHTPAIRHSQFLGKPIQKVAVLGGSGSFAIGAAKQAGADAFITADLKYHDFFQAENTILLADIGHYESEQFTKNLLVAHLTKKITNFAPALPLSKVLLSETNTNPVKYY